MARYQNIHSQIWHDEKFRTLSSDAKHLFLYVMTSPHSNAIGLYVCPKEYICADLGWAITRVVKAFSELLQANLILYDEFCNLICIINHLKYNPIINKNQAISAAKIVKELPRSKLYSIILKQLQEIYHEPLRRQLEEQYNKSFDKSFDESFNHVLLQPETETETETIKEIKEKNDLRKRNECLNLFKKFWEAYPKKRSIGQAEKAWDKLNPDEQLLATMLAKIERAKTSEVWLKNDGQFIPYPATWLNRRCWEDEYGTGKNGVSAMDRPLNPIEAWKLKHQAELAEIPVISDA